VLVASRDKHARTLTGAYAACVHSRRGVLYTGLVSEAYQRRVGQALHVAAGAMKATEGLRSWVFLVDATHARGSGGTPALHGPGNALLLPRNGPTPPATLDAWELVERLDREDDSCDRQTTRQAPA
jgi:hypothetical protein